METKQFENYAVLVPAYKPSGELMLPFIEKITGLFGRIVTVDDGGGAEFAEVFEECKRLGCTVLTHEVNRGKGAALKTGVKYIYESLPEIEGIITADCDGQHAPEDIIRTAQALDEHSDCLVIGGRKFEGEVPKRSMAGNTLTRFIYKLATGISIRDTQTGLRAFSRSLFDEMIELKGDRYEYEMNMLLKLREWGVSPYEIDIKTIYINENKSSHFNGFKDTVRIGGRILLFAAGSISSFVIDWSMFLLFSEVFHLQYWWAFGAARVISAICNYLINRKIVFGGSNYKKGTVFKYFLLAGTVMLCGMGIMKVFEAFPLAWLIKLIYDTVMYFVNYIIQRDFVFEVTKRNKRKK